MLWSQRSTTCHYEFVDNKDLESRDETRTLTLKHQTPAQYVNYSSDGFRIVSGHGKTIIVWDAETGKEILTFKGHSGYVRSVRFSPDARWIVSAGDDGKVKIWSAETGSESRTLNGHKELSSARHLL